MATTEAEFIEQWKLTFPHDELLPDTAFLFSTEHIAQRCELCRERIEEASRVTRRERFILNWLTNHNNTDEKRAVALGRGEIVHGIATTNDESEALGFNNKSIASESMSSSLPDDPVEWPLISPPDSPSSSSERDSVSSSAAKGSYKLADLKFSNSVSLDRENSTSDVIVFAAGDDSQLDRSLSTSSRTSTKSLPAEPTTSTSSNGGGPAINRQMSEGDVFDNSRGGHPGSPSRSLSVASSSSEFEMEPSSPDSLRRPKPRMRPKPRPRVPKRSPSGSRVPEEQSAAEDTAAAVADEGCRSPCNAQDGEIAAGTGRIVHGNHGSEKQPDRPLSAGERRTEFATSGDEQTNLTAQQTEHCQRSTTSTDGDLNLNIPKSAATTMEQSDDREHNPTTPTIITELIANNNDDVEPCPFEHKDLLSAVESVANGNLIHDDGSEETVELDNDKETQQQPNDGEHNKEDEEDAWVAALELGAIGERTRSKKRSDEKYKVVKGIPQSLEQMQLADKDGEEIYANFEMFKDSGSVASRGGNRRRAPLVKPETSDDSDTYDEEAAATREDDASDCSNDDEDTSNELPAPSFRHMTVEEIEKLKKWQSDEDIFQSVQRGESDEESDATHSPVFLKRDMKGPRQSPKPKLKARQGSTDNRLIKSSLEPTVKSDGQEEESEEFKNYRLRKLLVMNLVDSERCYVDCLDMLRKFMKPIQLSTETSQPILTIVDFNNIFFGVEELFRFHKRFMPQLESRVERWSDNQIIGDILLILMDSLDLYRAFINNYQVSKDTIIKCRNANATLNDIMKKDIKIPSLKEPIMLEGLLYKPVNRMTQYSLILNDLLKCTPDSHPDHPLLVEVTANLFDLFEQVNVSRDKKGSTQRHFLRDGFVVELDGDGERKARNLLLFSDCLICAKLKPSKDAFVCKWYAALADLHLKPSELSEAPQTVPVTTKVECDRLRASICNLRVELKKEQMPLCNSSTLVEGSPPVMKRRKEGGSFSVSNAKVNNKTIEKIKRKLHEQENLLKLIAPSLPWTLYHRNGKTVTLLLLNEGERHAWKEVLVPRIKRMVSRGQGNFILNNAELQHALEGCLKIQRFSARFANALPTPYFESRSSTGANIASEVLTGYLYVHILGGKGFRNSDTYCVLEVDCYNNFFRKAKTKPSRGPEPHWDEGFEMELESALCLRILCYNRIRLMLDDVCGKATIELPRENLTDGRQHQVTVSLDKQGSVTLVLSFSTNPDDIQRESMSADLGVFGVPIQVVARRECFEIPLIVITCVKEIDKRGWDEVGIYRLSGISSEIQMLKKAFNDNPQSAMVDVGEADIHAVAGLLKLYFRELPDPLFTAELYTKFLEAANISDFEEKDLYLSELVQQLPEVNRLTAQYLMEHLRHVAENAESNKMNLNNLATVFGPNVLRPGATSSPGKNQSEKAAATFGIGALDVMSQVSIFRVFLTSKSKRTRLPDDAALLRTLYPERALQEAGSSSPEMEDHSAL